MEPTSMHPDRAAVETMLRTMHEHQADAPIDELSDLIHPDAEMRLLVSFGRPLVGRTAVLTALERGREAHMFRANVLRFEWLDETTVLSFARARYALENGGMAEGRVFWLDQVRDGLIWRVEAFKSEAAARQTHGAQGG